MARPTDHVHPTTMTEEALPKADPTLELVRRVGSSTIFERSPRLRELLFYICEQAVQHHPEELKEQVIGRRVFGRAPDYSPGDDNIVRVEVRQLRKRLEEYFATEGKNEPVVIAIPKGGYVPAFEPRQIPPPAIEPIAEPRPRRRAVWPLAVLLGVLALAGTWWLFAPFHVDSTAGAAPDRASIWPLLFNGQDQTMIVCADSTLVMAQSITHRPITLEEYVQRDYEKDDPHLKPSDIGLLHALQAWQFTDITDVRLVQKMSSINAAHWDHAVIRSSRTVELQDFKNGNVVLLGSSRSNPWDLLFEPQVNFRFGYDFDPGKHFAYIQNMAPQPGEEPVYRAASAGQSGWAYSTVTLVPDLRHKGNVLIIAGTTAESTETAGEFIMNPEASEGLMRTLRARNQGKIPYFEVLLKSGAFAGVTQRAEVVALRVLPGN